MKKLLSKPLAALGLAGLSSLVVFPAAADDVAPTSGPTQANTCTTGVQSGPLTATDSAGNYVVVWTSSASCPLNAPDGNGTGVSGQRYNADRVMVGSEFRINVTTTADQVAESVAYDTGGNFVVTWSSNHVAASGKDVYARRYRNNGQPMVDGEFRVNTTTAGDQGNSRVAMGSKNEYLIVWATTNASGEVTGVFSRRYGSVAGIVKTQQPVASGISRKRSFPSVAMNASNYAVVTLMLPRTSASRLPCASTKACVVAVPYLTNGAPRNNIISVVSPSNANSFPADSSVGMADDEDNTAVVAFFGDTSATQQPPAQRGVLVQSLTLAEDTGALSKTGALIQVASNATALRPDISVASNGDFVVAYATANGSQAAHYAADGTASASLAAGLFRPANFGTPGAFIPNIDFDATTRQAIALDDDGDIVTVTYSNNRPTDPRPPADQTGIFYSTFTTDPSVQFSGSTGTISESLDSTSIDVGLSEPTSFPVTVNFRVGGTATRGSSCATPGVDYRLIPNVTSVPFSAGATSKKIGVDLCPDTNDEANETVIVDLTSATNAVLASPSTYTVTIVDND
ncbi:MAG: Calx-beta domain-containing protein [Panacagrimonas sp.]